MLRRTVKSIARWEREGRLTAYRTIGGHRRYIRASVLAEAKRLGFAYGED